MSVLACDRNGCSNIMCDRHSYEFGYICEECFQELLLAAQDFAPVDFVKFMDSPKGQKNSWEDICNAEFPIK